MFFTKGSKSTRTTNGKKSLNQFVMPMEQIMFSSLNIDTLPQSIQNEAELSGKIAQKISGEDMVNLSPTPIMGSEDFAYMLQEKPGSYIWIGNGDGEGSCMIHNPGYDFNDKVLPIGATYWVELAEHIYCKADN